MQQKPFHRFDDEERRNWQDPEAVLAEIGLKPGDTFMDIGCGGGFFTLPAARIVGAKGKVYGVDTDSEALARLAEKARKEGLTNVEVVASRGEEAVICQACADVVFFGIVLHDFDDPLKVLQNARRMLKPAGRLANLDWKKEPMSLGPPLGKRFTQEKAVSLIESAGFRVTSVKDSGKLHYLVKAVIA